MMGYDRVQLKLAAKAALRRGAPRPWLVTLVYLLLTCVPIYVLAFALQAPAFLAGPYGGHHYGLHRLGGLLLPLVLFLYVLAYLFTAVLSTGYRHYAMGLWRGRRTEVKDLFRALPMAGAVIRLYLLLLLFSLLWGLACLPALLPMFLLPYLFPHSSALLPLLGLLCYIGYGALYLNRVLRYALAFYVLLDHPDRTARECLSESKALMDGRRWSLFVLLLSFLGWFLLLIAILYAAVFAGIFLALFLSGALHSFAASWTLALLSTLGGFLLGLLCAAPLFLWLIPYVSVAEAGFYDQILGGPSAPAASGGSSGSEPRYYYAGSPGDPTPPPEDPPQGSTPTAKP